MYQTPCGLPISLFSVPWSGTLVGRSAFRILLTIPIGLPLQVPQLGDRRQDPTTRLWPRGCSFVGE